MDEYSFENYQNFEESHPFSDIFISDYEKEQKIQSQYELAQTQDFKKDQDDTFATNLTCLAPP